MHDHPGRQTGEARDALGDIVRAACLMAGHDDIGAVRVLFPDRPTFGDVLRVRRFAVARGMDVTLGESDIAFRRAPVVAEGVLAAPDEPVARGLIARSGCAAAVRHNRPPRRQRACMLREETR